MISQGTVFKIWVVDDEPGMCMGVKRTLNEQTFTFNDLGETVTFTVNAMDSGEKFLEALSTDRPDILLLDGKLPGINGIDILDKLYHAKNPILTIMITAYATLENAIKATKLGAFDFLAKPFTPDELRYSIKKATRDIILTRRAELLARQKKEIRFEFISVLAHELKAPLNAIEGYVDIVNSNQMEFNSIQIKSMFERIGIRINGMRKLIADLLDLTSLESGRKIRECCMHNITEVITKIIEQNKFQAQQRNITVEYGSSSQEIMFTCDRSEFEILCNNLITNAIKYNKEYGSVSISSSIDDESFTLTVSDTGIGINSEEQKLLFKEFSRIKNNRTRTIEGSGLGLSIVQKIVALYNGKIDVSSVPEKGSRFHITLPIKPINS